MYETAAYSCISHYSPGSLLCRHAETSQRLEIKLGLSINHGVTHTAACHETFRSDEVFYQLKCGTPFSIYAKVDFERKIVASLQRILGGKTL